MRRPGILLWGYPVFFVWMNIAILQTIKALILILRYCKTLEIRPGTAKLLHKYSSYGIIFVQHIFNYNRITTMKEYVLVARSLGAYFFDRSF